MATLFLQYTRVLNGEIRTLLLILLILAIVLIVAGAIIALLTYSFARKQCVSTPKA